MSPVNPETTNRPNRKRRRATSRFCIGGNPWAGNQQRAAYVTCWNLRVNSITIPPESRSDCRRSEAPAYRLDSLGTTARHGDGEFAKSNSRGGSGLTTGPSHRYRKSEKLVALSRRGLALARLSRGSSIAACVHGLWRRGCASQLDQGKKESPGARPGLKDSESNSGVDYLHCVGTYLAGRVPAV